MQLRTGTCDEQKPSWCQLGDGNLSVYFPRGCQHVADVGHAHLKWSLRKLCGQDRLCSSTVHWICDQHNHHFMSWTVYIRSSTLGMVLAKRRSKSLCESFPFTMNLPKGVRSITPTFSITSLHSLPTGPNQLVRWKLGLSTTQNQLTMYFTYEWFAYFITFSIWKCYTFHCKRAVHWVNIVPMGMKYKQD